MGDLIDRSITEQLDAAQRIVITSHIRPDGDAVGSVLGLAWALRAKGKQVACVLQDGVPEKYQFLPGAAEVMTTMPSEYDYLIVVDCSDKARTGRVLDGLPKADLVIDHHKTHEDFGLIEYVKPEVEATALILAQSLPLWGLDVITADSADCLLTGILSDTIGFRTSSTQPAALHYAAKLMELGANLHDVYRKTLTDITLEAARYWGQGLSRMRQDDGILWSSLSLHDRIVSGYSDNDDADLINIFSSIKGPLIAILFVEQEGGIVKVSWRSVEEVDVSVLAIDFGGGGHAAAAGAEIVGSLQEIQEKVIERTKRYLIDLRLKWVER